MLAQCVEAISKKHNRIPYRESKMTRILSLGQNNGLTVMFLNLAPVRSYHLDTISSLNFANRTKRIETRDVENELMTKGLARAPPSIMGSTMHRQPLRPLTETSHNILAKAAEEPAKATGKKTKAFAVYADKSRLSIEIARPHIPKRSSPLKRPSDALKTYDPRRVKVPRMNDPAVSQAAIENMVEKKVTEILASRTAAQPAPSTVEINDEVKKRLEVLEQRIENQGEGKSEGLTFLLMAKQHQAHGEEASALKMYQLAQEYFPENTKLEAKITKLRERMKEKKESAQCLAGRSSGSLPRPSVPQADPGLAARGSTTDALDDAYEDGEYAPKDEDYESDAGFRYKPKPKRPRAIQPFADHDEGAPRTPRTQQLLRIINSRDVAQIRLLRGVGAKKAEAIVAALCAAGEDDGGEARSLPSGAEVCSLVELGRLRGVGAKTVANMRSGLVVAGDGF